MFSKKDRENYDGEIKWLKKRLGDVESQLEYFKFKEKTPSGIKVTVESTVNPEMRGYASYNWTPTINLDPIFMYTATATWGNPNTYSVHTQEIIRSYGKPIDVRRSSYADGVISVAFAFPKIDGEYVAKWNTNSKTYKLFHNGVELPFTPNVQDGKIIFRYC